jgi:HK97 family phage major capsid protein
MPEGLFNRPEEVSMPSSMKNSQELTQEEVASFLIEPLTVASVVMAAGPRTFDSPKGDPVRVPRFDDVGDPTFKAENELIDETEPDWSELILLPTILKSLKTIHRISNELARHAVIPIGTTLQAAMVRKIAEKLDSEFLTGAGTADGNGNRGPIGLLNQAGVQTGTWDTSGATAINVGNDAIGKLLSANITDLSKVCWFVRPSDYIALSKVLDGDNRPLLQPDVTRGTGFQLLGYPIYITSKLPAGKALLADFNMIAVARDLAASVTLLNETFAQYDQIGIRVISRADIGLLHPEGVVVLTDATP